MGLALVVGVATKIVVEKENYYTKGCTKKDVLEDLKDELDFNLYNIEEDEKNVTFYIKEDVFVNNIYNLLVSETKDIELTSNDKEKFNLLLENIKNMDSVEKVKNVVEKEGSYFLHIMSGFCLETISYISKRGFTVYAELLVYNMAYKVLFESYYELFRYLRKKIQSAIDNPLKDDVFLMITTG